MYRENPWPHPRNNNGSTHMERFNANATTEITHKKGRGERNGVTKEAACETTEKCIEMFIGKEAGGGA
ncbi:hypothetical protein OUZ56_022712 [Daphnia magna]|uniref:Uncharacterized protein n=1 Tax=Daphnia magna TaxID=35525 RepID=A0ABR0AX88_9CRUS|nr:hypothetical protein OUZ56_022712 [Daphnia magna]